MKPAVIHYIDHPSFSLPQTRQTLWGPRRDEIDVRPYRLLPEVVQGCADQRHPRTSLTREQERTLFLRYNFAKYRLNELVRKRSSRRRVRAEALWRRRAIHVREKIVHANLPLVPAMVKRKRVEGVEFADKVSEGYMAVLRCVERFDVSRGYKFSTYACRAILAALARLGTKAQTYRRYVPIYFEPAYEQDDYTERRGEEERADAVECVRHVLRNNDAGLNEAQEEVIRKRYPMGTLVRPQPLWKIGRTLGVSTERARQIEKKALSKLGEALDEVLMA